MNYKVSIFVIIAALPLLPFASLAQSPGAQRFWVKHAGALRDVMRNRDFSARIDLAALKGTPHLYALGPSEGLNAEITVFDGRPAIAVVENGTVRVKQTFPKAAFLVYSRVDRWQQVNVPATVKTAEDVEVFVAKAAGAKGIDSKKPFPFLLRGRPERISYHVVKNGDHIPFEGKGKPIEVLGIYSASHHGVFTHHGTNIHLHFRTGDDKESGHIDTLDLSLGTTLYLPSSR